LGLALQPGAHHAEFRSTIFATWREPPLPVEFMAGFHHCQGGRWRAIVPAARQRVALDGKAWFVPDRAELGNILQTFGPSKDTARASSPRCAFCVKHEVRSCIGSHKTCRVTCDSRYSKSFSRSHAPVNCFHPKW
jgi:hypothetical protein